MQEAELRVLSIMTVKIRVKIERILLFGRYRTGRDSRHLMRK